MKRIRSSDSPLHLMALIIPFAIAILVLCVTAGYYIYHFASERAYREKWKDYVDCGLA